MRATSSGEASEGCAPVTPTALDSPAAAVASVELVTVPAVVRNATAHLQKKWEAADAGVRLLEKELMLAKVRRRTILKEIELEAARCERNLLRSAVRSDVAPTAPAPSSASDAMGEAEIEEADGEAAQPEEPPAAAQAAPVIA